MSEEKRPLRDWPEDEKPREKLWREGEHRLSDTELLAILLRTGTRGQTALELARAIRERFGSFRNMSHSSLQEWLKIKGLGQAKICQVKAALEIGRRLAGEASPVKEKISSAADVFRMLGLRMRDLKYEIFRVLLLDSRNRLREDVEIEQGTVNQAHPLIREVFQVCLEKRAAALICVHNHPSGEASPSPEDQEFTRCLVQAGQVLNVRVLDHVIIGDNTYYSFADHGLL
ncbi:MAG TPA: DNA repair protein RadC [bacterium]|nr:DNA repair protein RadC [bacterium]HOL65852.1 DNA repair protein RadC [bacterium]HPP11098.1 DNA repair protein RadC [bacterium]